MLEKPLVEVKNLSKIFDKNFFAIKNVSLEIFKGESIGIIGESGCGKTTLGKILVGLETPFSGEVFFEGKNLFQTLLHQKKTLRKKLQMIFQNPFSSLSPKMSVEKILLEPLKIHYIAPQNQIEDMLDIVGLSQQIKKRYPFELSGGQRQRVAIARSLLLKPEFLVCDEPTSSLDISIQAQILQLIKHLQKTLNLTVVFISHDMAVVQQMCKKIAVMYMGQILEIASCEHFYKNAFHPYSKLLLSSVLSLKQQNLPSAILSHKIPNKGCKFAPRCKWAQKLCLENEPFLKKISCNHLVACHLSS